LSDPLPTIQLWFDFASTYSYPAVERAEAVLAGSGLRLEWKPFLLGPIFAKAGWNDSPFNLYPEKGRYMWRDLERICASLDIPFRRPSRFPRNGLYAARIACCFSSAGWIPEFVRAIFRANFANDHDISDLSVLGDCFKRLGLPAADIIREAQSSESKAKLRAQTEKAAALGIFGAPTFVVDKELFWGNDRLESAIAWCRGAHPTSRVDSAR
jgi:2-hydroxychromene-2-carboxylate isomerase